MHILICNDDGIDAPGLAHLRQALARVCRHSDAVQSITCVAPSKNCSGASSALSLNQEITITPLDDSRFVVDGSPADCVHLAFTTDFLPHRPTLVLSGINLGANLGDDTIYSGTVACAIEAHLFGIPAIAFSLCSRQTDHLPDAEAITGELLTKLLFQHTLATDTLLNINIPDVAQSAMHPARLTCLGRRHPANQSVLVAQKPGQFVYRIGEAGEPQNKTNDTDFFAIDNYHVSVTPLQVDLSDKPKIAEMQQWF